MSLVQRLPPVLRGPAARAVMAVRRRLPLRRGLAVCGPFLAGNGLGQSARLYARAALAGGVRTSCVNVPLPSAPDSEAFESPLRRRADRRAQAWIQPLIGTDLRAARLDPRAANVLIPFWELESLPTRFHDAVARFEAVWAPSRFVAEAYAAATDRPVHLLPHPVAIPPAPSPRAPGAPFTVFTFFDSRSWATRKNPSGAVAAFRAAFAPARRDVRLIVKAGGGVDRGERAELAAAAGEDPRIELLDADLPRPRVDALVAGCDAFISVHRSEGFGLGPAEALAAGKPVVATGFSATTDYLSEATGFPVPWRRVPVGAGDYPEADGRSWAEPSIEAAADALCAIYDRPQEALARGARGRAFMAEHHGLEPVGRRMAALLADLARA